MEEDSKGTALSNVIRIDDERVRGASGPDRPGHGRGDAERDAGSGGRSAVQRRSATSARGPTRSAVGQLRAQAADQGRRGDAEGARSCASRRSRRRSSSAIGGGRARWRRP